ncbi:MAG: MFS transporter [Myxococcota bacterium]
MGDSAGAGILLDDWGLCGARLLGRLPAFTLSKGQSVLREPKGASESAVDESPLGARENGVIWTIWWTYGAFYFCRTNIAAAVPGLKAPLEDGGLGLDAAYVGLILASLKMAYGLGQLLNGQLAERYKPRKLLAVGMLGSALLNVVFGFSTAAYFLLFVWASNGYAQSLGWTPSVRVLANWIPVRHRGRAMGIVGTGYQVTLGLSFLLAGTSAEYLGWRAAMYIPAVVLAVSAVWMLVTLEDSPPEVDPSGASESVGQAAATATASPEGEPRHSWRENLAGTLSNRALWLMGLSLGLLNASRYGFIDWGMAHLIEVQDGGIGRTAIKYAVLPVGAIFGSYFAGWASDRFFGSRRAPMIVILLLGLSVSTLAYAEVARTSVPATIVLLGIIGFCIYGPQVLLVGTAPSDLAKRGTAAAAAGFVNFMGYMGAASGDIITGSVLDQDPIGGWQTAIYIWAGWSLAAACTSALLWNAMARD